jgi:hypothetical protein
MNPEEKRGASEPEDTHPTHREPEQSPTESPELALKKESPPVAADVETAKVVESADRRPEAEAAPFLPPEHEPTAAKPASAAVPEAVSTKKNGGFFSEQPPKVIGVAPQLLQFRTRRDVLLFGVGAIAALAGASFLLPQETLGRLGVHRDMNSPGK